MTSSNGRADELLQRCLEATRQGRQEADELAEIPSGLRAELEQLVATARTVEQLPGMAEPLRSAMKAQVIAQSLRPSGEVAQPASASGGPISSGWFRLLVLTIGLGLVAWGLVRGLGVSEDTPPDSPPPSVTAPARPVDSEEAAGRTMMAQPVAESPVGTPDTTRGESGRGVVIGGDSTSGVTAPRSGDREGGTTGPADEAVALAPGAGPAGAAAAVEPAGSIWSPPDVGLDALIGAAATRVAGAERGARGSDGAGDPAGGDAADVRATALPGADPAPVQGAPERRPAPATARVPASATPPLATSAAEDSAVPSGITGTVRDAEGAPIAGALVVAFGPRGEGPWLVDSDRRGGYRLDVPPGTYRVAARASDHEPAWHVGTDGETPREVTVIAGRRTTGVDVQLTPAGGGSAPREGGR